MKVRVCNHCGAQNTESAWSCTNCGNTLSVDLIVELPDASTSGDTGWKCKNCGNFNVKTSTCPKCGKEINFVPDQKDTPNTTTPKQTKADEYYQKGLKSFTEIFGEQDKAKVSQNLNRSQGYLTMAYKEAGDDIEDKKGIAGLMAFVLTNMDDYKNAESWANAEIAINPSNVFARFAMYYIELNKWVGHKGFVTRNDGSGFGLFANLITTGVDVARQQGKKNTVHTAGVEAAKAIANKTQNDPSPNQYMWILWSSVLLSIIDNMWANNLKDPYLCNVLLNLPWHRFPKDEIKELEETIEDIQVDVHGYLSRLK